MKLAALWTLLLVPACTVAQTVEEEDPLAIAGGVDVSQAWSGACDSAARMLAVIEIAKADGEAAATSFWRRLIPSVTLGGTFGIRDLIFPEAGGTMILPRDAYRISATVSLSGLFDGAGHERAELARQEAEARLALLLHRQEAARLVLRRKAAQLREEISALEEELAVWRSLVDYQELLFTQGKTDFRAVARARVDGVRLRGAVERAHAMLHGVEDALSGEEGK